MACEYCLNGNVSEEFRYCPKCGEHIGVVRGLRLIKMMAEETLKVLNNCTKDENGNVIITEREPITVEHFELGRHPVKAFEPEKVDISRELIWLEANGIINGGTDDV